MVKIKYFREGFSQNLETLQNLARECSSTAHYWYACSTKTIFFEIVRWWSVLSFWHQASFIWKFDRKHVYKRPLWANRIVFPLWYTFICKSLWILLNYFYICLISYWNTFLPVTAFKIQFIPSATSISLHYTALSWILIFYFI